ncbi:MAG: hypothetical protein ACR2KK_01750, partial [Acidimicrobiales bacterium]
MRVPDAHHAVRAHTPTANRTPIVATRDQNRWRLRPAGDQNEWRSTALGDDWADVPVRPGLCFVDAEWGLFAKPFELDGVLVTWAKALRERLGQPGPYTR